MADDRLQPTPSQLETATNQARTYWRWLTEKAITCLQNGTALGPIFPRDMLCRVPAIPATQLSVYEVACSDSPTKALLTGESSTMRVAEAGQCDVGEAMKEIRGALLIGVQSSSACTLSGTSFRPWRATGSGDQRQPNYIAILSLAWSYILCTRLVETQQQDSAEVTYTDSTASWNRPAPTDRNAPRIEIDIGRVNRRVARWWAAILAPNLGWRAIVTNMKNEVYLAPWSISLQGKQEFRVVWQDDGPLAQNSATSLPPTSQDALKILAEFCVLHDLRDQYFAAFAATLTFPTHNHYGVAIALPPPATAEYRARLSLNEQSMNEYLAIGDKLAHYMALSCNHSVVMSSLCGSFWEPDIPCNLVSAWLHPVLEEIPRHPEIADDPVRYAEIVALMCGTRRPRLSALWVGAALSGLVPKIIAAVRRGTPPLDPNGFSWTGSPQSFMDLAGSGPYFHREASGDQSIERADAWRLLYLPVLEDDGLYYNSLPFSPWQPVGKTREQNCALRVRAHETCPRHRLVYIHWTWQLQDGSKLIDSGFRLDDHEPRQLFSRVQSPSEASFAYPRIPLSSTQGASREASMEIFRWVLANHEGRPPEEPIYDDDWIAGCDDSDRYGSDPGIKDCPNDIVMGFPEGNSNNQQISSLQEDRIRRWVEDI